MLRKAAQDQRFRPAATTWKRLTPNWIQVLSDDVTPELARVVHRLTQQPMAERLKHSKDLGETMVIAHAVVAAEAGADVVVLVIPHRIYIDGGVAGSGEIFGARDVIASTIQSSNAETCCEYNLLKLARGLFFHTGDPKYMQYYERTLFGQILASRRNTSSDTNPNVTYFICRTGCRRASPSPSTAPPGA